ncbi:unnamed protein product [Anisakis simplex]|uniref:Nipped-B-like protein pqn-85 (inferred by orthology to a C. elegans protein) n=1 Tax=Anisakis simplex TaxID=6269 RepID=A0A0M3J864_ANISI|nr:unnamed protein product [Anisakis simplex]
MWDLGVAVRKRVIRIMREICERQPEFGKIPEMLSRIVRRVCDEEGVKKLTLETFQFLWFQPVKDRVECALLIKKVGFLVYLSLLVVQMTEMVQMCMRDNSLEFFEQLLNNLLKGGDKTLLLASTQMVDTLVDNILTLDSKIASVGIFVVLFVLLEAELNLGGRRGECLVVNGAANRLR